MSPSLRYSRRMALAGLEWVIVAVIIIVLLLWGPSQLPKMARALGEAKKEFKKAAKEAEEMKEEVRETVQPFTETVSEAGDELLKIARELGISTEGKTREQIAEEILRVTKKK
ncbi:MAG: twin-arginine translocase TatA/TatE family subunit [Nitrososphaerota archaeon]